MHQDSNSKHKKVAASDSAIRKLPLFVQCTVRRVEVYLLFVKNPVVLHCKIILCKFSRQWNSESYFSINYFLQPCFIRILRRGMVGSRDVRNTTNSRHYCIICLVSPLNDANVCRQHQVTMQSLHPLQLSTKVGGILALALWAQSWIIDGDK